jgi:hypothetical protein
LGRRISGAHRLPPERLIQVDPPIADQELLVVLSKRITGVPNDPTEFYIVVRTLPTAVYVFTLWVWHCTAISGMYRVCKLSLWPCTSYRRKYGDLRENRRDSRVKAASAVVRGRADCDRILTLPPRCARRSGCQ